MPSTDWIAKVCMYCFLLTHLLCGQSESGTHNPAIENLLKSQVRQVKVSDCDYRKEPDHFYDRMSVASSVSGTILITGRSNDGAVWRAILSKAPVSRCEVWIPDPAFELSPMVFVVTWGINGSGGWDTNLSLLLFDKKGKPMPWQATSNFTVNDTGIEEVVRPPGAEAIGILVPTREAYKFDKFTYIYDLYDVVGDRVQSVVDTRYGLKLPLIPENRPDLRAHHVVDVLSTSEPGIRVRAPSRMKILVRRPDDDNLEIHLENGVAAGMPQILVDDTARGERSITFEPGEADLRKLIDASASAQIIGKHCDWDECVPLILRASKR